MLKKTSRDRRTLHQSQESKSPPSSSPTRGIRPASPGYRKLIAAFPLRPLRTEKEWKTALAVVESLMLAELDEDEADYLDLLSEAVEKYETKHYPIPDATEGEMLAFLMQERRLTQQKLAKETGVAQPIISAVLTGVRGLTKVQIVKMANYFHVSPAVFLPLTMTGGT